jgi:hypothetical protein
LEQRLSTVENSGQQIKNRSDYCGGCGFDCGSPSPVHIREDHAGKGTMRKQLAPT